MHVEPDDVLILDKRNTEIKTSKMITNYVKGRISRKEIKFN